MRSARACFSGLGLALDGALDHVRPVDDRRIGPGVELDAGLDQQRELDVGGVGPGHVLGLADQHHEVHRGLVGLVPAGGGPGILIQLEFVADLGAHLGQDVRLQVIGEVGNADETQQRVLGVVGRFGLHGLGCAGLLALVFGRVADAHASTRSRCTDQGRNPKRIVTRPKRVT
jgi:hypothetical protein